LPRPHRCGAGAKFFSYTFQHLAADGNGWEVASVSGAELLKNTQGHLFVTVLGNPRNVNV
jgi:hypothetical protein